MTVMLLLCGCDFETLSCFLLRLRSVCYREIISGLYIMALFPLIAVHFVDGLFTLSPHPKHKANYI